jgi:hypothetical protein
MAHMKAVSVLVNLQYPKIWIYLLRYENTAFTRDGDVLAVIVAE